MPNSNQDLDNPEPKAGFVERLLSAVKDVLECFASALGACASVIFQADNPGLRGMQSPDDFMGAAKDHKSKRGREIPPEPSWLKEAEEDERYSGPSGPRR